MKHTAQYFQKNSTSNLLIIAASTFIFIAVPITVYSVLNIEQTSRSPQAAEFDAECAGNPDPVGTSQCGANRTFCDTWQGGYCEDYRSYKTTVDVAYPGPNDPATFDCLDATSDGYLPQMLGSSLPFPCAFSKYEHFMTRMESGSFGIAMLRYHQPVDIPATGTRRIHFDADIKGKTRNYFRVMLSPDLTKRDSDDRSGSAVYPKSFIQAWVRNGAVQVTICRQGVCEGDSYPFGDAFGSDTAWMRTAGQDNVRVPVDIYISQTSFKMTINGVLLTDETVQNGEVRGGDGVEEFANLGFDKAYLYLSQASYNPCKDGQCAVADQITHWDNVAFDGPVLPRNSLTPPGMQDVVWNSYAAVNCTVKGYPAAKTSTHETSYTWQTWVARMPKQAVSQSDINCGLGEGGSRNTTKQGFEVVSQDGTVSGDTTNPTVSITAPTAGSTVSGSVNLTANATDASGINLVEFYVDNAKVGVDNTSPYSFAWDSTKVANGSKTLSAKAYDTVGNLGTSSNVSITVSNATPPPPPPSGSSTIDFNDMSTHQGHAFTVGEYPTGVANWGSTSQWYLSTPFAGFNTPNISFNGSGVSQASFDFVTPKILKSIDATNGGNVATTVTISCSGNSTKTQILAIGETTTITTGWTSTCTRVTIASTNGWNTNFDNFVYENSGGGSTPPPPPVGLRGDLNSDGRVNIIDASILFSKWGTTDANADLNDNGTVDIFDSSILFNNWTG